MPNLRHALFRHIALLATFRHDGEGIPDAGAGMLIFRSMGCLGWAGSGYALGNTGMFALGVVVFLYTIVTKQSGRLVAILSLGGFLASCWAALYLIVTASGLVALNDNLSWLLRKLIELQIITSVAAAYAKTLISRR